MNIGVFSYYFLPVVNGVTITIADWKRVGEKIGAHFILYEPGVSYPAVGILKRFGITVPMFPELFIEKELRKQHIDILHVHHPFYIGNLALFAKIKLGIPLVFTYHTRYADYFSSYLPWFSGEIMSGIVTRILVRFMNACDAVTVANESLKQEILRQGVRTPIFIVPPGIDTYAFAVGDRTKTRKRFGLTTRDTVLLYVGRLAKEKNIYFLLRSFIYLHKQASNSKLLLVGNGPEEQRLRSYAKKNRLSGDIIFAVNETLQSIADMYAAADMFVYASQTETYGRVIVEAMAARLPIVALAGPSIIDLLQDGITGRIVFKRSPRAFAAVVVELVRNTVTQTFLGTHAQIESREKYDSAASWKALHFVYRAVIEKYHG